MAGGEVATGTDVVFLFWGDRGDFEIEDLIGRARGAERAEAEVAVFVDLLDGDYEVLEVEPVRG